MNDIMFMEHTVRDIEALFKAIRDKSSLSNAGTTIVKLFHGATLGNVDSYIKNQLFAMGCIELHSKHHTLIYP